MKKPSIRNFLLGVKDWVRYKDFGLQLVPFPRWFKTIWLGKAGDMMGEVAGTILGKALGYGWGEGRTVRLPEYIHKLPDGAGQATDVFLPRKAYLQRDKVPTILIRLPYWKDNVAVIGRVFANHGYACVLQDIRGTGHSTPYGSHSLNMADRDDGLETLRWISKRFWYNGKIGMWGASYFGLTQWAVSWDNDHLLTCAAPLITSFTNLWNYNGGLYINALNANIAKIVLNTGSSYDKPRVDEEFDKRQFTRKMVTDPRFTLYNDPMVRLGKLRIPRLRDFEGKTLQEKQDFFNQRMGIKLDFTKPVDKVFYDLVFNMFVKHMLGFTHRYNPANIDIDVPKVDIPLYMVGGFHDMFCDHQLRDYAELMNKVSPDTRKNIRLVMGPWNHGGIGLPGIPFNNGGFIDLAKDLFPIHFFEYWLKGKTSQRWKSQPPVKFYVMGQNKWHYTARWPPVGTSSQRWYLHSEGNANSARGDGKLSQKPPEREFTDRYIYDPMDPVFTEGGQNLDIPKSSTPQTRAESRQDVLVYTSAPLKKDLIVAGSVVLEFWASTSVIDTDFMAKLCDVYPNGKSYNVVDMGLRCRYRNGKNPEPMIPDEIYPLEIVLGNTAMSFQKGHRLRLNITSSNFPRYDVNSNMGGVLGGRKYEKAEQRIYHSEGKESCLILPIWQK